MAASSVKLSAVFCVIALFTWQSGSALRCMQCGTYECKEVDTTDCPRGLVTDICNCCSVCGKDLGDRCGGIWDMYGKCGDGLRCRQKEARWGNRAGRCVPEGAGGQQSGSSLRLPFKA